MHKRFRKIVALLICAGMLGGYLPQGSVNAAETGNGQEIINEGQVLNTDNTDSEQNAQDPSDSELSENFLDKTEQEDQNNQEQKSQGVQATEKNELSNQEVELTDSDDTVLEGDGKNINYIYVESPYLDTSEQSRQNVVVSWGDGTDSVTGMTLVYCDRDGNEYDWKSARQSSELFAFEKEFSQEETGTYSIVALKYVKEDVPYVIELSQYNAKALFGVNEEYPGYEPNVDGNDVLSGIDSEDVELSVVSINSDGTETAEEDISSALEKAGAKKLTETAQVNSRNLQANSGNLVVVLDPGHDGISVGARGYIDGTTLKEEELTLKIAQYCKNELESYKGVSVYMTRSSSACPAGYSTSGSHVEGTCLKKRVQIANAKNADVLVSIHLNASNGAAYGAEVYYPNSNYNASVGAEGQKLAQKIQDELVRLGLANRGIKVKNTVNDTYPNGTKQDWYAIIRESKLAGFPGLIVEHAFLDNASDARKHLMSSSGLKALGVADARGIANAYSLKKETTLSCDTSSYSGYLNDSAYQFLVETNVRTGTPTVTLSDASVASVTLASGTDSRGYLYNLKGKKAGSTTVSITMHGKTVSFKATFSTFDFSLDTSAYSGTVGGVYQFLARITDKRLTPVVKSSNPSVAAVSLASSSDARGYLYQLNFKSSGTATISVTCKGITRKFVATVRPESTKVSLDTRSYSGTVGDTYGFLVKSNNRVDKPVVSLSNSSIATVKLVDANDSRGYLYQIEGLTPGMTTVSVYQDGASAEFQAVYKAYSFTLDTSKVSIVKGKSYQFLARITNKSNGTPKVSSSDTSVATVSLYSSKDSRGYLYTITGKSAGTANITVTHLGTSKTIVVTVTGGSTSTETTLSLDTRSYSGTAGNAYGFLAKTNNRKTTPTVTLSDSSVASVRLVSAKDSRGFLYEIKGLKAGSTIVTVKHDGKTASFPAVYQAYSYTLDTSKVSIVKGKSYQFLARITNKSNGTPKVSSSDTSVATVSLYSSKDSRGYLYTITGKSAGTANITVTHLGTSKTIVVTVTGGSTTTETTLSLDTRSYSGTAGNAYGFLAKTNNRKTTPTVTLSDSSVASVRLMSAKDSRGFLFEIKGLKAGSTIVTVKHDGKTASFPAVYQAYSYSLDTSKVTIPGGERYQFLARIADKSNGTPKVSSSNTSIATVSLSSATDSRGYLYTITAKSIGKTTISVTHLGTVKEIEVTIVEGKYLISGNASATINQMVNLFRAYSSINYETYYKNTDAPTLYTFCKMYYDEAAAEGIKAEVAFAQAMVETGWLKYGGDVKRSQFNFGGIGATGNGVPGESYASVQIGIRAQIQHLKAYANTLPLNKACVDGRFKYVTRGCSPYVEWLGIQENPYGYGWAAGADYGSKIIKIIKNMN